MWTTGPMIRSVKSEKWEALNKFFGSRRLRASPQGYSPWTSVAHLPTPPYPLRSLRCALVSRTVTTHFRGESFVTRRRPIAQRRGWTEGDVGSAQPRSRASSPGETPAGDDCQKTCYWRYLASAAGRTRAGRCALAL